MKARVSVVLPTLEEVAIFGVIKDVRRLLGKNTEIIAVARGSGEYFKRLRKLGVKVVYQRIKGVERSVMLGFNIAKGDLLATTDADGTHGSEGLLKGARLVASGRADFVLGNRMNSLQKGSMPLYVVFGNSALSMMFSGLYGIRVHDVLSGLFVVSRSAYASMKGAKPYRAGIAFFGIELAKRGYRIGEVDIRYYPRRYGRSVLTRSKFAYGLGVAVHMLRRRLGG